MACAWNGMSGIPVNAVVLLVAMRFQELHLSASADNGSFVHVVPVDRLTVATSRVTLGASKLRPDDVC